MKELVFRMTKTQLDTVASQMAGNGPECVMVAECGAGNTTWVSGVERSSWSFQSIIETTTMFEFSIRPLEPEPGRFCVFAARLRFPMIQSSGDTFRMVTLRFFLVSLVF